MNWIFVLYIFVASKICLFLNFIHLKWHIYSVHARIMWWSYALEVTSIINGSEMWLFVNLYETVVRNYEWMLSCLSRAFQLWSVRNVTLRRLKNWFASNPFNWFELFSGIKRILHYWHYTYIICRILNVFNWSIFGKISLQSL